VRPHEGWSGTQTETATLSASGAAPLDKFGYAVAINGTTAVVGAYGFNSNQGAAYVFVKPGNGWSGSINQAATLTLSSGAEYDFFGASIDTNGDTVVVGAPFSNNRGLGAVFVQPPDGWSGSLNETAVLKDADGVDGEQVGQSIAINGYTVIVGTLVTNTALVFDRPTGGWSGALTAPNKLTPSDGVAGDQFGQSVALRGGVAVVGANRATVELKPDQGKAYIFTAQYPLHTYIPVIRR
jgi:hypothetical protein